MYNPIDLSKAVLKKDPNRVISFTDEKTHYDVSFAIISKGNTSNSIYQSGINRQGVYSLLIAVNHVSSFVFDFGSSFDPSYIAEKLNISEGSIAEDISELAKYIQKRYK